MHKKKSHVLEIIKEFNFEKRKIDNPDACPLYRKNIKCHDMESLCCFFCYCPYYDTEKEEGGCLRNSKDGKWHLSEKLPKGRVWDCSGCTYPHEENIAKEMLLKAFT